MWKTSPDTKTLILLMGPVGCGKSSFINSVAGKNVVDVNHDMKTCSGIQYAPCSHPTSSKLFIFVETPGFDTSDETRSNSSVALETTKWMKKYFKGARVGGILYLQPEKQAKPMLTDLLKDSAIKETLLHIVTVFAASQGFIPFQIVPKQENTPPWVIIDKLVSAKGEHLTVGILQPELAKIAGVLCKGRQIGDVIRGWFSRFR